MSVETSHHVFLPATQPPPPAGLRALIYFIPGNPGFIDWYTAFLEDLRAQLDASQTHVAFDIYGRSLPGFHSDEHAPFSSSNPPYSLEDHISVSYASLASRKVATPRLSDGTEGRPYDFVVMLGHSVGAYIALEIFHRHQRDLSTAPHLHLHHGILLCPTITHIARSSCGRLFSLLCRLAIIRTHLHRLLALILLFIPSALLYAWTHYVLGFSPHAASIAASFLKSPDAVRQTLHMGADEMEAIAADEWDEELWEVLRSDDESRFRVPKFFFLFAETDHWVSCKERDEFITRMKKHAEREGPEHKKGRTEIEVDNGRFPHAFSTKEGEFFFSFPLVSAGGSYVLQNLGVVLGSGANVCNRVRWACRGARRGVAREDTAQPAAAGIDCLEAWGWY